MKTSQISDLTLERYVLGELPKKEMNKIDDALQENDALAKRLNEIKSSNEEILEKYTPLTMTQDIRIKASLKLQKGDQQKKPGYDFHTLGMSMGLALSVIIFVVFMPSSNLETGLTNNPESLIKLEPGTRTKGLEPFLQVFRKNDEHIEQMIAGDLVVAGDVIQISYIPVSKEFGMIISIDGNGVVTQHLPYEQSNEAERLGNVTEVWLDNAYELDDAPSYERFYFITSNLSFNTQEVLDAANQLASEPEVVLNKPLVLSEHLSYSIFTLNK